MPLPVQVFNLQSPGRGARCLAHVAGGRGAHADRRGPPGRPAECT
uniref:G protein pathway suppressor 1 n=2 Tax=Hominidae TaxID=9604 RepID=J3KRY5_HUMAN